MFVDDRLRDQQFDIDGRFVEHPVAAASIALWDREYTSHMMQECSRPYGTMDWPGVQSEDNPWPEHPSTYENLPRIRCSLNQSCTGQRRTHREHFKKQAIPSNLRWIVWERDNFTCVACGARKRLSVDHIIPESKGGLAVLENLQTLCCRCNSRKGNR